MWRQKQPPAVKGKPMGRIRDWIGLAEFNGSTPTPEEISNAESYWVETDAGLLHGPNGPLPVGKDWAAWVDADVSTQWQQGESSGEWFPGARAQSALEGAYYWASQGMNPDGSNPGSNKRRAFLEEQIARLKRELDSLE